MNRKYKFLIGAVCGVGMILGITQLQPKESPVVDRPVTPKNTIVDWEIPEPAETVVSMSAVGDVLMEEGMYQWMGEGFSFGTYFDDVKPLLQTDLAFVNQEVLIGGEELGIMGTGYQFNAPNEIGEQIYDLGFNIINLANNHSNDKGILGMENSLRFWRQYPDILTLGMYDSPEDRASLKIMKQKGIRFGFLSYTYATNIKLALDEEYRLPYFLIQDGRYVSEARNAAIAQEVAYARENCDILIVSMHWGPEFQFYPNQLQLDYARMLNDLGVDVILGHHSHGMMPIEWIENEETQHKTLVAYSLGNFVSADVIVERSTEETANAYSLAAVMTMDFVRDNKTEAISIENVTFVPLVNHYERNYQNFHLYRLADYTEELAARHYRRDFSHNFTKAWMERKTDEVMARDFVTIDR